MLKRYGGLVSPSLQPLSLVVTNNSMVIEKNSPEPRRAGLETLFYTGGRCSCAFDFRENGGVACTQHDCELPTACTVYLRTLACTPKDKRYHSSKCRNSAVYAEPLEYRWVLLNSDHHCSSVLYALPGTGRAVWDSLYKYVPKDKG